MDGDGEDGGAEARAVASLALAFAHEAFDVFADEVAVGFFVAALEGGDDAFVDGLVGGAVAPFGVVAANGNGVFVWAGAVEDLVDGVLGEIFDWCVDGKVVAGADGGEALEPPGLLVDAVVGADGAFGDGEVGVED